MAFRKPKFPNGVFGRRPLIRMEEEIGIPNLGHILAAWSGVDEI